MSNVRYCIGQVKHHKVEKWHGVKAYVRPGPNMASQKRNNAIRKDTVSGLVIHIPLVAVGGSGQIHVKGQGLG